MVPPRWVRSRRRRGLRLGVDGPDAARRDQPRRRAGRGRSRRPRTRSASTRAAAFHFSARAVRGAEDEVRAAAQVEPIPPSPKKRRSLRARAALAAPPRRRARAASARLSLHRGRRAAAWSRGSTGRSSARTPSSSSPPPVAGTCRPASRRRRPARARSPRCGACAGSRRARAGPATDAYGSTASRSAPSSTCSVLIPARRSPRASRDALALGRAAAGDDDLLDGGEATSRGTRASRARARPTASATPASTRHGIRRTMTGRFAARRRASCGSGDERAAERVDVAGAEREHQVARRAARGRR